MACGTQSMAILTMMDSSVVPNVLILHDSWHVVVTRLSASDCFAPTTGYLCFVFVLFRLLLGHHREE